MKSKETIFPITCIYIHISYLGFTVCKAKQPLQGIELKEKEEEKDEKHLGKLFKENPKIEGVCINSRLKDI